MSTYTVNFYSRNAQHVLEKMIEHTFESHEPLDVIRNQMANKFNDGMVGVAGVAVSSREVSYFTVEKVGV